MKEEYLLTNTLEYTNEPYAIAKIAGIKMCESYNLQYGTNFISVMPTNLYGPNDNFDLEKSHVLPALIRKIHLAKLLYENNWKLIKEDLNKNPISGIDANSSEKEIAIILAKHGIYFSPFGGDAQSAEGAVEIWGSGKPRREFLWSEDMADACVFIMQNRDFNDIVIANEMKQSLEKEQSSNFNDTVIAREVKQSLKTDQNPNIQDVVIANEMKQSHELEQSSNQNSAKKGFQPETRNTHINIGTGTDISIKELAETIKNIIGFKGDLVFNTDKPDGTMRKLTDVSKLNGLGWTHKVELGEGVKRAYKWYIIK